LSFSCSSISRDEAAPSITPPLADLAAAADSFAEGSAMPACRHTNARENERDRGREGGQVAHTHRMCRTDAALRSIWPRERMKRGEEQGERVSNNKRH
jgi:hypothetical protein